MHATLRVSLFPSRDIVTFPLPFKLCEKTHVLIQRERVSLCSELCSTLKASSRVSYNHCCELNFDFSNEMAPRSCPVAPLSVTSVVCSVGSLPAVPTHALASHGRQPLCQTTRWSQPSPEFLLGRCLVLNRSLLLIDSGSDLSHRHLVSTFDPSEHPPFFLHVLLLQFLSHQKSSSRTLSVFLVLYFLIRQQVHHEFKECFLLQFLTRQLVLHEFSHVLISVFRFSPVHPTRSS